MLGGHLARKRLIAGLSLAAGCSGWRPADSGEVLEADRRNRLVISWRDELHEELRQEGHSEVSYVMEDDRHVGKADGHPIIRSGKLRCHRCYVEGMASSLC